MNRASGPGVVVSSVGSATAQGGIPDGFQPHKFYVWPDSDRSYVKLIWKHPTQKYPKGFHILGTRFHPIGDFDREDVSLPDEPLRIYRTMNGYRVFFKGRYDVNVDSMFDELDAMGGDPLYSKYARIRRYYACRIEPKVDPFSEDYAIASLVADQGETHPGWGKFIDLHDQLCNSLDSGAVLV